MATVAELQEQARDLDIEGRSSMNKSELEAAIRKAAPPPKKAKAKKVKKAPRALAFLPEIRPGHQGTHVIVAQALLRAHGHQVGALDGIAGRETTRAVRAFRSDRKLPEGDRVDAAAWAALAVKT